MKISRKGFTLAELLIVVAIIAVLVAVAIPIFGSQLEKSREAADLANVRAAYAEVLTEANMGIYNKEVIVNLKQKQYDWQSADVITIGGISHSVKEAIRITGLENQEQVEPVRFRLTRKREPNLCGAGMGLLRQIAMT